MSRIDFGIAKNHVIQFGEYRGKSLDQIAETDKGLLYLDWMFGEQFAREPLQTHLRIYLNDPTIKKELEAIKQ